MFEYMAKVVSVYDGDTIRVDLDLGFGIKLENQSIRFLGLDTPEVRGDERDEGIPVRDYVREQILDKEVMLRTYKDKKGKYGRWLAEIYYRKEGVVVAADQLGSLTCLNDELLKLGMAEEM
jgi:micrococcal nuclease